MTTLMFVDDEPLILKGLQRTLRPMREEWNIRFAEGGPAAMQMLQEQPADVVVSDMRMPGMNGAEFLGKVAESWPETIRIALSGQADVETSCESAKVTHQFLAKPCELDQIKHAVDRAGRLKERLDDKGLETLIGGLGTVPSLPETYQQLTEELESPDCSIERVGQIVASDVSMTAKILQMVNSAYFGMPREISTPTEAATYLGIDTLRSLVLSVSVFSAFADKPEGHLKLRELWDHSMRVGNIAKRVAEYYGLSRPMRDVCYLAGMMHDIGVLLFAANDAASYDEALAFAERERVPTWRAEREVFGKTHMEAGAYLLGIWTFPERVVEAVAYHHRPSDLGPADEITVLTAVHVANAIADTVHGTPYKKETTEIDEEHLGTLGLLEGIDALQHELAGELAE